MEIIEGLFISLFLFPCILPFFHYNQLKFRIYNKDRNEI
jgi:hypothetical protein